MGLKKGMTNNPAGKPVGTVSHFPKSLKIRLTEFLESSFEEVIETWKKLEGKDKLMFYKDVLQYVIPKQREVNFDISKIPDEIIEKMDI